MRVKLAGLVATILTASCAVHIGTDGSSPSAPRSSQARRAAPAPPPPAPPPAVSPRPAAPAGPAAPPPAAPAVAQLGKRVPAAQSPAAAQPAPVQANAVAPSTMLSQSQNINLSRVLQIASRNPKNCGYVEVSEKNWVHIDCARYQPSARAVLHLSPRKARLVKSRKSLVLPLRSQLSLFKSSGFPALKGTSPATARPATGSSVAVGGGPATGGPAQVATTFPDSVDHREQNLEGPIKSQGGVGSCTGHSLSSTLDNAAIRAGNLKPGDKQAMTSPMHVWSRYGLPNMGAAADGNVAQPVAIYSTWQQSDREACMLFQGSGSYATECAEVYGVKANGWREDKALMAKYDRSQAEGVYKISSIEKLETEPPNMEELLGVLSSGADVWAAFLIDGRAWSNSKMTNAVISDWTDSPSGHAVVISGYRQAPTGRQFLIHNSWGESWGDKGYAWLSEKMLIKNLYYAYKVKITNGVKKEDLTDDDCAPDELIDLGTGLCAIMCNDDERPNNGCKK